MEYLKRKESEEAGSWKAWEGERMSAKPESLIFAKPTQTL
jgi:hypothetical protein